MCCFSDAMCKLQDLLQSFLTITVASEFSGQSLITERDVRAGTHQLNTTRSVCKSNRKCVLACLWQQENKLNFLANENTIFQFSFKNSIK